MHRRSASRVARILWQPAVSLNPQQNARANRVSKFRLKRVFDLNRTSCSHRLLFAAVACEESGNSAFDDAL